jgi:site-specific DNA recombinase
MNRPGVRRVLALVEARKIDAVIVAKLDRLTRSVKDLSLPQIPSAAVT